MAKKRSSPKTKKAIRKAATRKNKAGKKSGKPSRKAAKATVNLTKGAKKDASKWRPVSRKSFFGRTMVIAHMYIYRTLLAFGKIYQNDSGYTRVDATKSLSCCVTADDMRLAEACDGNFCVVARVLARALGDTITSALVGYRITILVDKRTKTAVRFKTPDALSAAIKHFDLTKELTGRGEWLFKRMQFELRPLPKNYFHHEPDKDGKKGRWHLVRLSGGKQSKLRVAAKIGEENYKPRVIEGINGVFKSMSEGLYSVACRVKPQRHEAAPVIGV